MANGTRNPILNHRVSQFLCNETNLHHTFQWSQHLCCLFSVGDKRTCGIISTCMYNTCLPSLYHNRECMSINKIIQNQQPRIYAVFWAPVFIRTNENVLSNSRGKLRNLNWFISNKRSFVGKRLCDLVVNALNNSSWALLWFCNRFRRWRWCLTLDIYDDKLEFFELACKMVSDFFLYSASYAGFMVRRWYFVWSERQRWFFVYFGKWFKDLVWNMYLVEQGVQRNCNV